MAKMAEVWPKFYAAYRTVASATELLGRPSVASLPERMRRMAPWVASQLRARPTDPHATLMHGDYKAANLFLPRGGSLGSCGG